MNTLFQQTFYDHSSQLNLKFSIHLQTLNRQSRVNVKRYYKIMETLSVFVVSAEAVSSYLQPANMIR